MAMVGDGVGLVEIGVVVGVIFFVGTTEPASEGAMVVVARAFEYNRSVGWIAFVSFTLFCTGAGIRASIIAARKKNDVRHAKRMIRGLFMILIVARRNPHRQERK